MRAYKKCAYEGCSGGQIPLGNYCASHMCQSCFDIRLLPDDPNSKSCIRHSCMILGCVEYIHSCRRHKCRYQLGCFIRIKSNMGSRCEIHRCAARGCHWARVKDLRVCKKHMSCGSCMIEAQTVSETSAVHNLFPCKLHRKCVLCVNEAVAVPKTAGCVRDCCRKKYSAFFPIDRIRRPGRCTQICMRHMRLTFYAFMCSLHRNDVFIPRDIRHMIWMTLFRTN